MTNNQDEPVKLTPFDFIEAVSTTKKDLILNSDDPEQTEKLHNSYLCNKAMSYFSDTVLHANEMNRCHGLFPDANFRYYLNIVRSRKRRSKWFKPEKNDILTEICDKYNVNRRVAAQYNALLTPEQRQALMKSRNKGGNAK